MARQAHDLLKKQKEEAVFEDFSKTWNFTANEAHTQNVLGKNLKNSVNKGWGKAILK